MNFEMNIMNELNGYLKNNLLKLSMVNGRTIIPLEQIRTILRYYDIVIECDRINGSMIVEKASDYIPNNRFNTVYS